MSLYSARRQPVVMIRVNGEPAQDFMDARISYRFTDKIGKKTDATLVLSDPNRSIRDTKLQPDDHYQIAFGWPGNLSRVRNFRLKKWTTNNDADAFKVSLTLKDTGTPPKKFQGSGHVNTEPGKTRRPKNWGKIQTSDIAKRIARRHGMIPIVDPSDDIDRYDYVQAGNVTDFGYLRRRAEIIDFEFFMDGERLYYREKPYDERPRRVFYYHPQGGRDTLLLSFTPTAKVTTVSVRPRTVNVQAKDAKWIQQEEIRVAENTAKLFNAPLNEAEFVVAVSTQATVPEAWASAEVVRKKLNVDPTSIDDNIQHEHFMAALDRDLQNLQAAKKAQAEAKKPAGKVALKSASQTIGSRDQGDNKCSPKNQKPGSTPTGSNKETANIQFQLRKGTRKLVVDPAVSQSTVQTTAGTSKLAKKIACASHSKRKDRAVTATATFIGDPALMAKVNYQFEGVGVMFSGSWYAKEATHTIAETYTVSMNLKKGTLRKVKKGKGTTANNGNDTQGKNEADVAAFDFENSTHAIVSADQADKIYEAQTLKARGYYTPNGDWVPVKQGTGVPSR